MQAIRILRSMTLGTAKVSADSAHHAKANSNRKLHMEALKKVKQEEVGRDAG